MKKNLSVLGIDLGFGKMGLCSINLETNNVSSECYMSENKKISKELKYEKFIQQYFIDSVDFENIVISTSIVCMEKPFNVPGYGKIILELLGIVKYKLYQHGIPFIEIPQTSLKKFATNNGRAQKSDMVMRAYKEYNFEADTEDEVDAFWCAMVANCFLNNSNFAQHRIDSVKKLTIQNYKNIKR